MLYVCREASLRRPGPDDAYVIHHRMDFVPFYYTERNRKRIT